MNKTHPIAPKFKNVIVKIDDKSMIPSGILEEINGVFGMVKLRALIDTELILHNCIVLKYIKVQCKKIIKF